VAQILYREPGFEVFYALDELVVHGFAP